MTGKFEDALIPAFMVVLLVFFVLAENRTNAWLVVYSYWLIQTNKAIEEYIRRTYQ